MNRVFLTPGTVVTSTPCYGHPNKQILGYVSDGPDGWGMSIKWGAPQEKTWVELDERTAITIGADLYGINILPNYIEMVLL